jgi:hypothetical protein
MNDLDRLKMIADELRGFAANASGNPATVRITAKTLLEYAEALEIAANPPTVEIHSFGGGGPG